MWGGPVGYGMPNVGRGGYPSPAEPAPPVGYVPPEGPGLPHGPSPLRLWHPWEIPTLIVAVLVSILVWIVLVTAMFLAIRDGESVDFTVAAFLLGAPILIWAARGLLMAQQRLNAVPITPYQFPEAHAMVVDAAQRFRMTTVPDAYVVLGNGVLNAFASGHGFRRYVAVNSDLFEVGGRLRDPETLRFIIGHEVGHIAAGHASYWRQLATMIAMRIPLLGSTLSRAQEYSADNHGYLASPIGSRGMTVLSAGKYLYPTVNFDSMADRAQTEKGFFAWWANALASHPVQVKRLAALRDRSRPGRMF